MRFANTDIWTTLRLPTSCASKALLSAVAPLNIRPSRGTRELKVDDTAKGKLYEQVRARDLQGRFISFVPPCQAQLIADAMARLATAAQANDKAGILNISKEIATATQTVVAIAKTIPAQPQDKEQIVSYALAAKGTGVQLKILSAVKASIEG